MRNAEVYFKESQTQPNTNAELILKLDEIRSGIFKTVYFALASEIREKDFAYLHNDLQDAFNKISYRISELTKNDLTILK
jgi:hypothetical protein